MNLVPLFGVLFFGWDLFSIVLLYWLENGVIGFFNVFKIMLADRAGTQGAAFYVPFFVMHYGLFWLVHGVFVVVLFGFLGSVFFGDPPLPGALLDLQLAGVLVAIAALTLSHGTSFFLNYVGHEEYRRTTPDRQMFEPYGRAVALHVTIIGGAVLSGLLGTPLISLVILVSLKTALDLLAHAREHLRARRTAPAG